MYCNSQNRMRMRIFNVLDDVKREHGFAPIVTRPADSPDFRPRVNWSRFHETMPLAEVSITLRNLLEEWRAGALLGVWAWASRKQNLNPAMCCCDQMAHDPYAASAGATRNAKLGMTHSDGVNGPADITGAPTLGC